MLPCDMLLLNVFEAQDEYLLPHYQGPTQAVLCCVDSDWLWAGPRVFSVLL